MSREDSNTNKRPRKPGVSWRNLPAFCDASATVSATTFGARRLPEIKDLWSKVSRGEESNTISLPSSGGRKTSSRHLRRRATSHASRKRHRYPDPHRKGVSKKDSKEAGNPTPSRRSLRRNVSNLQLEHETWRREATDGTLSNSPDRVNWMATHFWHAKRFHMGDLWGWRVPMMHSNRGPGAALRLLREGKSLLQDVTWSMQPIWLQATLSSRQAVQQRIARIIPEFDFGLTENSTEESVAFTSTGQGTLHGIDQFPMQAVGPVNWMCSRRPQFHAAANDANLVFVYLWIHPSIRTIILELLEQIFAEKENGIHGPHQSVEGGVSCLRLRGKHTTESLRTALLGFGKYDLSSLPKDVSGISDDDKLAAMRHGVTVPHAQNEEPSKPLLLVSRCPRDPTIGMNIAVCTLDIFCDPDVAKGLFLALVLKGASCPVGVAEEAHLHLECHPPVPLFPRDYPDTDEGISYWEGNSPEWKDVREYWESGVGRFRPDEGISEPIDWKQIVPATTGDLVVVVRGGFGKPFLDTMSGCGIVPHSSSSPAHHRKRRRVRDPTLCVSAQHLSKDQAAMHLGVCTTLSQSLSLPAVLLCHLRVLGPGTVAVGAGLYALEPLGIHLGFATAGAFSSSLGSFHGIGVVGAARLLEVIASAWSSGAAIISNRPGGGKEIQLRVRVSNGTSWCESSLALLL
jgi:hypothetical protein